MLACLHARPLLSFLPSFSVPLSARRLFPSGVRWLFSSWLCGRGEVVITLFRYLGPQWNHSSAETIKHFLLNGRTAPQTLKLFARNFTLHQFCFPFLRNSNLESDFCLFVFFGFSLLETEGRLCFCVVGEQMFYKSRPETHIGLDLLVLIQLLVYKLSENSAKMPTVPSSNHDFVQPTREPKTSPHMGEEIFQTFPCLFT